MLIRSRYSEPLDTGMDVSCEIEVADQHYKDSCQIQNLYRYGNPNVRDLQYGDATDTISHTEAVNLRNELEREWEASDKSETFEEYLERELYAEEKPPARAEDLPPLGEESRQSREILGAEGDQNLNAKTSATTSVEKPTG